MTYEEKLDLIISEIVEARKGARAGKPAKIFIDKKLDLLKSIALPEIYDILLKLQDDEKIIEIKNYPVDLDPILEMNLVPNKDHFSIKILDNFDSWYSTYLLSKKSKLGNIDFVNLLKIYDVVLDIEQQLQLEGSPTVRIPSLPSLIKFQVLCPIDTIGQRDDYQSYRWASVKFLSQKGIALEYRRLQGLLDYGSIEIRVDIPKFNAFLEEITEEYKKRNKSANAPKKAIPKKPTTAKKPQPVSYDSKKGELEIKGDKVKFKKDSFRAKVLELLLADNESRKKEWSWDEVIEAIEDTQDDNLTQENKKKFYPACDGLSKHIASKTSVNDLLIFNKSTVRINPKYL